MTMGFQKSKCWVLISTLWLLAGAIPLQAMDEDTAKTIADLKAQLQSLMDKVQKLESQTSQTPTPPISKPEPSPSVAIPPSPQASPKEAMRPLMEEPVQGTTETAPATVQQKSTLPGLDISEEGLIFRSKDNQHAIRLGGLLQADLREFVDDGSSTASKFLIRRARPYASGYFYEDWNYRFAPEFALASPDSTTYSTTIADAMINYKPMEEIQIQAGKFKAPVSLEMNVAPAYTMFSERSVTENLTPNRDIGVMVHGKIFDGKLSWAAMVGANARNDTIDTGLDVDSGNNGYFRLFSQPFKDEDSIPEILHGLRLGVGGSIGYQTQSNAGTSALFQSYSTDGGNAFFNFPDGLNTQGQRWRISPQLYYNYNSFGLLGEFIAEKQGVNTAGVAPGGGFTNYESTAWNVSMNYILTGEDASLDGVLPKEPLDFKNGGWGAWEIALRYDGIALGENMFRPVSEGGLGASATQNATAINGVSGAINWYINRIIRLGLTVEYNAFSGGGAPGTVVENNELGFLTRLQLMY
jgi:phosphate-selective porin OprO/OprP